MVVADQLRQCDFRVIEAATASEAITVLEQPDIKIDVVISGVSGSSAGFSLAGWVRENRPGLEVKLTGGVRLAVAVAVDLCDGGPSQPNAQSLINRIMRLTAASRSPSAKPAKGPLSRFGTCDRPASIDPAPPRSTGRMHPP
jgi:hypothetical protein